MFKQTVHQLNVDSYRINVYCYRGLFGLKYYFSKSDVGANNLSVRGKTHQIGVAGRYPYNPIGSCTHPFHAQIFTSVPISYSQHPQRDLQRFTIYRNNM